ncbi:hypothetical protein [Actinomadura harenae]|uniref:Uncharacterized protein n=1 Tax=Actinomadura harenae TaxID=2483351 RepID=A0A3M2M4W2_9ACTN|nr:hypothetical protein [Actinomadura harenae]RMI44717.1 hypothetical protein EBO15_12250 [Actinomadura harenae]
MTTDRTRVRVLEGRQIVTELGHHHGGETLTASPRTAADWIRWGWAEDVTENDAGRRAEPDVREDQADAPDAGPRLVPPTPEPEAPSAGRGRANVAERIAQEIRANPSASDRELVRLIGCDHKTVGRVRRELEPNQDDDQAEAD